MRLKSPFYRLRPVKRSIENLGNKLSKKSIESYFVYFDSHTFYYSFEFNKDF